MNLDNGIPCDHRERMLTGEAARILGCSPETVRRLERLGQLTAQRTESGVRLFDRRDVEHLAQERRARRMEMSR